MTIEFTKRVESWNRLYKGSRQPENHRQSPPPLVQVYADEEASSTEAVQSEKPKKTFSQMIYEWNQHYKSGHRRHIQQQTEESEPTRSSVESSNERVQPITEQIPGEEEEHEKVSIADRVAQWNKHYKSKNRTTRRPTMLSIPELDPDSTTDWDFEQVTNRICQWEKHYRLERSNHRSYTETKSNRKNSYTGVTSPTSPTPQLIDLVTQWNERYSVKHQHTSNEKPQYEKSKWVTSMLVKHWDKHYAVRDEKENSLPNESNVAEKKSKRNKVNRKPSLVKSRIEKLAMQSAEDTIPKYKNQAQMPEITKFTCRSNFAEIRSKFAVNCYRC